MSDRVSADFGRRLREARERRGLSLRQISITTKIAIAPLEALERNDFARLPGGIFTRAFIRAYAVEVGLDPDATLQEFIEQSPRQTVAPRHASLLQPEDHQAIESQRRAATTFVQMAAIGVPLAVAIMYASSTGRHQAVRTAAPVALLAEAESAPAASTGVLENVAQRSPGREAVRAAAAEGLTVTLATLQDCWIVATVDGDTVVERLMRPGEQETFDVRRELLLTVGDASALAMTINGIRARSLGQPGQVVRTRLDPTNVREFLATP